MKALPRRALFVALIAIATGTVYWNWKSGQTPLLPAGFSSGNGRIEALDIDIATKSGGRVREVLVDEGDRVDPGQILAVMDTDALEAELRQARAQLRRTENAQATADAVVRQRESLRASTQALIGQRTTELQLAESELSRSTELAARGFVTPQRGETDRGRRDTAQASLAAARAQATEVEMAIVAARSQVTEAASAIEAARAVVARIETELADATLRAPRGGRVQHRLAQPGEVLAPGGKVLTVIDLDEAHMIFFLPEAVAGRLAIGAPARLVLDSDPALPLPATVSFVSAQAQFTPKTVETSAERQKLVFRVKARLSPELIREHGDRIKPGMPGMAYVRLERGAPWPEFLRISDAEPDSRADGAGPSGGGAAK